MIKEFDKPSCRMLGDEAQKLLAELAARHGLTVTVGGGTFDSLSLSMKVRFSLSANNPGVEDAERELFARYCNFFGLKPEHYGTHIPTPKYGPVKLVGFNLSRSKFPIKVRLTNGKALAFTEELVRKLKTPGTLTVTGSPFEKEG